MTILIQIVKFGDKHLMYPRNKYNIPETEGNLGIMKFNLVIL